MIVAVTGGHDVLPTAPELDAMRPADLLSVMFANIRVHACCESDDAPEQEAIRSLTQRVT